MGKKKRSRYRPLSRGLVILYEDSDLLVVNKPAGLLTVKTETEKTRTVHYILTDYVRKGTPKSRNQIFTVHRLDQWTSGVLIFAKSEAVMDRLKDRWKEAKMIYIAVVHGQLTAKEGVITSYLAENARHIVYSTPDAAKGKLAQTAYKVLKEKGQFSLLEINLLTGRKNQIRVHLADQGHPIVGDRKYGDNKDGFSRLALHSKSICFPHPTRDEVMTMETKVPGCLRKLVGVV
ncbi:MAG: RluA family pseudouridine synthase [Planctomycetota bacterium]|jgi:tRNA pseudouridine32 synthase/23S rRNA pseudouridine746 synthase/23S rRNA pseudouridine1911/1915/1917 synthase